MQDVGDIGVTERLKAGVARLLRVLEPGRIGLVRRAGWTAVPLPGGAHLSTVQQDRILALCAARPGTRLWAVPLEALQNVVGALAVQPDRADLQAFNHDLSFFQCALVGTGAATVEPDWVLACFTEDYLLALGPPALVEPLSGDEPDAAFRAFVAFAQDPDWPPRTETLLLSVCAAVLRAGEAAPGTTVPVP